MPLSKDSSGRPVLHFGFGDIVFKLASIQDSNTGDFHPGIAMFNSNVGGPPYRDLDPGEYAVMMIFDTPQVIESVINNLAQFRDMYLEHNIKVNSREVAEAQLAAKDASSATNAEYMVGNDSVEVIPEKG